MEPLFGSWTGAASPPRNRVQQYILRRGFPSYNHPPWLNHPGTPGWNTLDGKEPWKKHRGPAPPDEEYDEDDDYDDDDDDDDDDVLDGLDSKAIA